MVNITLDQAPTVATGYTNLGQNLVDHTPTITWTKGTDADSGDTVTTYVYVGTGAAPTTEEGHNTGTTIDLGSTVTLTDGVTYYYRLRSYDGERWSDYTTDDTFRMNSEPTVNGVQISPGATNTTTGLTGNGTYDDAESDGESGTTYKWFKNDAEVGGETTTSLAHTNFVKNDEIIFQYIPNDSYEAGTAVNSSATTIGNIVPVLSSIGAKNVNDEEQVSVDADGTDQDVTDGVDTLTFSCNRTDLFSDFSTSTGAGAWTPFYNQTGVYYVDFGVNDGTTSDNETITITVSTLQSGWEIFGWTTVSSMTAEQVVHDIGGNCQYLTIKNATTGNYVNFNPAAPGENNFTTMKGKGYYAKTTATAPFSRSRIDDEVYNTTLQSGWDIFGWTNVSSMTAEQVVNDIGGNCQYLTIKNATTGNYVNFNPAAPGENNFDLTIGIAYYAKVSSETVWVREA
jgi:hypothetical protein